MPLNYKEEFKVMFNSSRYGKHYFIGYDEADEILVIENFLKYNSNFIILKIENTEFPDNEKSFYFYYNDINLELLFSDCNEINADYSEKNKVNSKIKYRNYIYFYMIPNEKDIIKIKSMEYYKLHIGKTMIENISKYCVFNKEIILNNKIILKFTDTAYYENENTSCDYIYLSLLGGIGDFFLTFSVVYDYLKNIEPYKSVYIINSNASENFKYMIDLCYGSKARLLNVDACNIYFRNYWIEKKEKFLLNKKIEGMFKMPETKADNMAFLYKQFLIGDKEFYYYKYADILNERILKSVSDEEKNYINGLIKDKKNNIGFQYFTGNFNEKTNAWDIFGDRKWDVENIKSFIEQCKKRDINLISLNSETYDSSLQEFCTKKLSIAGYALLISKMDLVVGTDSSAGHIASFYNVPSITLWGMASPLELHYYGSPIFLGYRTLRKNYSIIAKNKELSSINHSTVFSLVEKFIKNELLFEDRMITYKNSRNGYNMLYV